ncbi:hypothetical protein [Staphylococcus caeli]|uniref:hypothetical protein n=1 Tax=Staphylococcus caeli TaxID=2201815 RepID=UPI003F54988B
MSLPVAIVLGIVFIIAYTYLGLKFTIWKHERRNEDSEPLSKIYLLINAILLIIIAAFFIYSLLNWFYFI